MPLIQTGVAGAPDHANVECAASAAVVPLLDSAHSSGPHDAEHACVEEDIDVVVNRAVRTADCGSQFGDGRGPLEDQVEDRGTERMGDRAELRRGGDLDGVREVVVRDAAFA